MGATAPRVYPWGSIDTTIGTVHLSEWHAEALEFTSSLTEASAYPYSTLPFFVALFIFLLLLARRSKYAKSFFGIVLLISVIFAIDVTETQNEFDQTIEQGPVLSIYSPDIPRSTDDIDTLQACGTRINYVFGSQAGQVYYQLQDQGYELQRTLATTGSLEPTREELCKVYDELRKTYTAESIVLQHYLITDDEKILPFDGEQLYGDFATRTSKRSSFQYGFFTRSQGDE